MRTIATGLVFCAMTLAVVVDARAESRLQRVRARGYLVCGVETGVAGFATVDAQGRYAGLEDETREKRPSQEEEEWRGERGRAASRSLRRAEPL